MPNSDEIIVSAISAGQTRLQVAMETYRAAVKQMAAVTGADILAAFNALLDENPLVNALTWEQYTPYFRDGEECVFDLHGRKYGGDAKWARSQLPDLAEFDESCEWDKHRSHFHSTWRPPGATNGQNCYPADT